jgi:serine/threonine-protein kinase
MELPSRIAKYKIIRKIGEGGSGCVVLAEQDIIHRIVALKILFPELIATKKTIIKRFKREARLAASLIHPCIVPIFEIDEEENLYYYAMQYIEGKILTSYIAENTLTFQERFRILIELCDALSLAHSKNIVHRDLKPHNIIITPELHPVILDFGIAKSLNSIEDGTMTQVGHILGSAHYMAPEQASPGTISTATDVFGLGVMIYELFTGQRPFQGDNIKDLIIKRIQYAQNPEKYAPQSMLSLNKNIPELLNTITFHCLEAEQQNRYQTAGELLVDLQKLQDSLVKKEITQIVVPKHALHKHYPFICFIIVFIIMILFSLIVHYTTYFETLKNYQNTLLNNIKIQNNDTTKE